MILDKKLKLIYNPSSGNQSFKNRLHECITVFQKAGYETHVYSMEADIEQHIAAIPKGFYDAVAVSGGDGTTSIVTDALFRRGHNIPLLVIPSGTANDFASFLKIPRDAKDACELIQNEPIFCDAGFANGRFFLNVCAVGFLADISQIADKGLKNSLGNMAYYLTLLGKLTNLSPLKVRITTSKKSFEDDIYLLLALNSSGIGGFSKLSPDASVSDGLFDFIIVKAVPLAEFAMIIVKLLSGEHLNDPGIIYFQDHYVKVEAIIDNEYCTSTDIDGEAGPSLPVVIENRHDALRIFK